LLQVRLQQSRAFEVQWVPVGKQQWGCAAWGGPQISPVQHASPVTEHGVPEDRHATHDWSTHTLVERLHEQLPLLLQSA